MTNSPSPLHSINDEMMDKHQSSNDYMSLTYGQSIVVCIGCGMSSSIINHPFQVLRARYQNSMALYNANITTMSAPPKVLTFDPRILFKGFTATLLGMWCMTITQSISKKLYPPNTTPVSDSNDTTTAAAIITPLIPSVLGGFWSAAITTPLEGTILRQSKTATSTTSSQQQLKKLGTFQSMKHFVREHGIQRAYHGGLMIGIRTTIVGSAFSIWTPIVGKTLQEHELIQSTHVSTIIAGMIVGTLCATISQPFESIRIEQQFTADEKTKNNKQQLVSIRQAILQLLKENNNGVLGLFKGGSYRIPRTAPGVVINAVVYNELETYFHNQNVKSI